MKNLFKNLMLVAVAAMAFTACTETNDEVNAVSKKTVLNGVVGFAEETRSGFSEETSTNDEGKTVYHSEWDGNESILVVCNGQAKTAPITKNDEGNANFTVEFDGELGDLYFVSVYSPASAFDQSGICTIPSEQTPRANSVDPAAHALSVSSTPVSAGSAYFAMQHSAAYGKMTVKGVDFKIDHVVVDLKGSYSGYDRELSYTINADNVENNTFWFATEPIVVAEFTVTAYDAEGNSVTKTVDVPAEKNMSFQYGRVGTFSVSGLQEYYDYTSARVGHSWGATDKLISFTSAAGEEDFHVNFAGRSFSDNSIAAGDYSIGDGIYSYGIYLGDYYGEGKCESAYTGNLSVTIVDGRYVMVFTDLKDVYNNMLAERITFKGLIDGLEIPDPRAKLAAPDVTATVSGKTITLAWDRIEGAEGYTLSMYNPVEEQFEEFVTDNQYVFKAQKGNTKYNFKITATVSDDNQTYRTSDEAFFDATTEDIDPKIVLSKESISFTADGGNDAVDVTLKNIDGDFTYTVNADWLTVTRPDSGASLAVSAPAYDNESQDRSAIITITAGELSQTITVTQSKKGVDPNALTIWKIAVGYDQPGEKEIQFYFNPDSPSSCHVIDFKGSNVVKEQPLAAGYYSSGASTINAGYSIYDYGTTNGKPSFVDCTVTNNDDGTQTYEVRMTYNSVTYSWTYTGAYPA